MIAIGLLFVRMLFDFFRPWQLLEAEILVLRHQLNILLIPEALAKLNFIFFDDEPEFEQRADCLILEKMTGAIRA
jgi:hypothetical protein